MNLKLFGVGTGVGVVSAIPFLLLSALLSRKGPDANLANFGPALVGIGLLMVEMSLALIFFILGCIWLGRHRWRRAGFGIAFPLAVIGGLVWMWLCM